MCGRLGPAVTLDRERSSKAAMGGGGGMRSTLFCLKMSSKSRVHTVGGRGAAQNPDNCKGTVTRDAKWYEVRKGGYTVR
jgi:hypothetical protein